jgi:hypothetical protein
MTARPSQQDDENRQHLQLFCGRHSWERRHLADVYPFESASAGRMPALPGAIFLGAGRQWRGTNDSLRFAARSYFFNEKLRVDTSPD